MDKYLYFRSQKVITDDDDSAQSALFPWSSFMGMHPTSDTTLTLFFKAQIRHRSDGQEGNAVNNDSVILTIPTNTHKTAIAEIIDLVTNTPQGSILYVGDDYTGSYASNKWSAISTISIAAAIAT